MRVCSLDKPAAEKQKGAVLLVAMIMLVLILIIGLAAGRLVQTQEAMTGGFYDRSMAFQAAETALREGESRVLTFEYVIPGGFERTGFGQEDVYNCNPDEAGGNECDVLPDPAGTGRGNGIGWLDINEDTALSDLNANIPPQFYIDRIGSTTEFAGGSPQDASSYQYGTAVNSSLFIIYRITARSHDPNLDDAEGRSLVVLQSIIRRQVN